jgi:hypothetical protein
MPIPLFVFYFTFWVPVSYCDFLCISLYCRFNRYNSCFFIVQVFHRWKSGNFITAVAIKSWRLIYLLAGAFAVVSKAMGGVDAVVNLY